MKISDKLLNLFVYVSLVVMGVILGIAVKSYANLPLDEEVNLMDVATLAVTIFLAVYVPAVLGRKLQIRRDKKELIIGRITDYQQMQKRINSVVQEDHVVTPDDHLKVNNLLDVARQRLETLIFLLKSSGIEADFVKEIEAVRRVDTEHCALLLGVKEIPPRSGYSKEVRTREKELFNELDKACSLLVFKVSDVE